MTRATGRLGPICAVCGRVVERFEERRHPYFDRVEFRVYCHGETQLVQIDATDVVHGLDPYAGVAFADHAKRLMPPSS